MKLENLDQSNILRNYSPKWLDDDNPWVIDSRSSTTFGGLLINIIFQDLKLSNNFFSTYFIQIEYLGKSKVS